MKKGTVLVLLLILLCGLAAIAEADEYVGCKHIVEDYGVLKSKDKPIALQFAEETTGFTSGACRTCKQVILFCTEEAAKANHIECDGTTHVFIRSSEVYKEGVKTEYTIKLADYFGVSCDYLLRGIHSEDIDIARATGLNDKSIQNIKIMSQLAAEHEHPNLAVALNDFVGSVHFVWFLSNYMMYQNKMKELFERLEIFKEWLIQHEVKPPKDLLEYAAKVALENSTTPAMDVMHCQAELKFALFRLHNSLDDYVSDMKKEGVK